jgi:CheY-like chemotaxis protein
MAKLIVDSVDLARAGSQIRIELSLAEDLRCVEVDPGQIGQVLHNILLNARQAMAESGIIEVRAENVVLAGSPGSGTRVRIAIRDYGCGIPFDVLPRIFDPYFTTKRNGRGLGLATAYAIVAKHGGSISAESKPGHGTVFTIDLPASTETAVEPQPAAVELHRGSARLLIMDDEDGLRELLRGVLTTLGYEVETAADGAEAIALCEHALGLGRGFDAVLLDLTVTGGMGGIETAAMLKEVDPRIKLIVSSGYSDAPVMSEFRKYGFDGVIPKPWRVAEVSAVFQRVLAADRDRKTTGL